MSLWAAISIGFTIGGVIVMIWNYVARRSQVGTYVCFALAGACGLIELFG